MLFIVSLAIDYIVGIVGTEVEHGLQQVSNRNQYADTVDNERRSFLLCFMTLCTPGRSPDFCTTIT